MQYLRTKAIVLSKKIRGETDVIFSCYTPHYGKLEVLAGGAKKIISKLNSHCQPATLNELLLARGINFWRLAGAYSDFNFSGAKLNQSLASQYLLGLTDKLVKVDHTEEKIYLLLAKTLKLLIDQSRPEKITLLTAAYLFKLLAILGYQTNLKTCLKCRRALKEEMNYFDFAAGGILGPTCFKMTSSSSQVLVKPAVLKVLRILLHNDLAKALRLKLSLPQSESILQMVIKFWQPHTDVEVKSLLFY